MNDESSQPSDKCLVCSKPVHFDVNTGDLFKFCESHLHQQHPLNLRSDSGGEDDMAEMGPVALGMHKCAIEECFQPRHVDARGIVHDCCGYTHAMEYIRRQMVKRKDASNYITCSQWYGLHYSEMKQVVKGVSHCLIPECNRPTWPFKNYCGRKHAQLGKKRGLICKC